MTTRVVICQSVGSIADAECLRVYARAQGWQVIRPLTSSGIRSDPAWLCRDVVTALNMISQDYAEAIVMAEADFALRSLDYQFWLLNRLHSCGGVLYSLVDGQLAQAVSS